MFTYVLGIQLIVEKIFYPLILLFIKMDSKIYSNDNIIIERREGLSDYFTVFRVFLVIIFISVSLYILHTGFLYFLFYIVGLVYMYALIGYLSTLLINKKASKIISSLTNPYVLTNDKIVLSRKCFLLEFLSGEECRIIEEIDIYEIDEFNIYYNIGDISIIQIKSNSDEDYYFFSNETGSFSQNISTLLI